MLKTIVTHSTKLVTFLLALELALLQPQLEHLTRLADALLVCDGRKVLSNLYRQFVEEHDPKTAADFFRESPWEPGTVGQARKRYMLAQLLEMARQAGCPPIIWVSVDDSLGKKDKATRHLEAVAFQHNHTESTRRRQVYSNGFVYVQVHVQIGPFEVTFDLRLYLREKTIRHLNRQRTGAKRLKYQSKYKLACAMLTELAALLPTQGYQVYVLFDAWYASANLIKFCRRHGWHVICALKSNRCVDGKALPLHDQALRHKHYQRVRLGAGDSTPSRLYYVRALRGHIRDVPGEVAVIISRRHTGDKFPKYFLCTDLSLSAQEALLHYQRRWAVEVDNFYLKQALGLGDFRLHHVEATHKWFEVVLVAMNYLQWQQAKTAQVSHTTLSLADLIRQHRTEHLQAVLRAIAERVRQHADVDQLLRQFIIPDGRAVT